MNTVAVAGVGLIGGSFALALRKAGFAGEILGVSSPQTIEAAIAAGAINRGATLEEAAATADLLYLAQPVELILATLKRLGPIYRAGCLVTDAGSTKQAIVDQAGRSLPGGSFLGGHPMAGKESRGVAAADADLFAARPYVLTPVIQDRTGQEPTFRSFLEAMGAQVLEMPAEIHDSTVAFTSHLPQLVSSALAATLASTSNSYIDQVFGTGLLDMTRLALSSPDLWLSILATNRTEVTVALDRFIDRMTHVRESLQTDNLESEFLAGNAFSAQLRKLDR